MASQAVTTGCSNGILDDVNHKITNPIYLDRKIENFKMVPSSRTTASEWTMYVRRFERLLWVKGIRCDCELVESAKATLLLTYMGDMTLSRWFRKLRDYAPAVTLFAAQFASEQAIRNTGEKFAEFADRLRFLSIGCSYGQNLNERLRHRFAIGLSEPKVERKIRCRWPEGMEDGRSVSFEAILEMSLLMEQAMAEVEIRRGHFYLSS
ncbi:hypothetical protein ACOME3_006720 [Neoechinorhynchus agilis]